jgi:hypothetical protein
MSYPSTQYQKLTSLAGFLEVYEIGEILGTYDTLIPYPILYIEELFLKSREELIGKRDSSTLSRSSTRQSAKERKGTSISL